MWQKFISRPAKQQLLEESLTLLAQWFQPKQDILYSQIETKLDNIAQQVMKQLKSKCPNHPIFSVSRQQFSYWRYNNIEEESQWNNSNGKQILHTLCKVIYELKFRNACDQTYTTYQEYHFINHVSYRS